MKQFITTLLLLGGCAAKQERTKWTDPVMRVMVDPTNISAQNYVEIVRELHDSGKWIVVDRADGFRAIKKEQELLHREHPDRFADKDKYAHWGRLYGVGGVVTAHVQCVRKQTSWTKDWYEVCEQNLAIIHANTGEVLTISSGRAETEYLGEVSSWTETVEKLNKSFPKYFEKFHKADALLKYEDESRERAVRQKEEAARELLDNEVK